MKNTILIFLIFGSINLFAQSYSLYRIQSDPQNFFSATKPYQLALDLNAHLSPMLMDAFAVYSPIQNFSAAVTLDAKSRWFEEGGSSSFGFALGYFNHLKTDDIKNESFSYYDIYLGIEKKRFATEEIILHQFKYYLQSSLNYSYKVLNIGLGLKLNIADYSSVNVKHYTFISNDTYKTIEEVNSFQPIFYPEFSFNFRFKKNKAAIYIQLTKMFRRSNGNRLIHPHLTGAIGGSLYFDTSKRKTIDTK